MSVNLFVTTNLTITSDHNIVIKFADEVYVATLNELHILSQQLKTNYQAFISGRCKITTVLLSPIQLLQYAVIYLVEQLDIKITTGLLFEISSAIPIGCGMGSSAAVILSILRALDKLFTLKITPENYIAFGRDIENMQHGISSGLDLYLGVHGGCYLFEQGQGSKRCVPKVPLQLVNTGKPQSTTGECVENAVKYFKNSSLADDFAEITLVLDNSLQQKKFHMVKECIKENHRLLQTIGVVPKKIAMFIDAIEHAGGTAKISGAGAIYGDNAGILLVASDASINEIVDYYGYEILKGEENVLRII